MPSVRPFLTPRPDPPQPAKQAVPTDHTWGARFLFWHRSLCLKRLGNSMCGDAPAHTVNSFRSPKPTLPSAAPRSLPAALQDASGGDSDCCRRLHPDGHHPWECPKFLFGPPQSPLPRSDAPLGAGTQMACSASLWGRGYRRRVRRAAGRMKISGSVKSIRLRVFG